MEASVEEAKVERYSTYKDSGIKWVNEIPEHWKVGPLFSVATLKSATNHSDQELLSVYLDKGVIRFSDVTEKRTNVTSVDLTNYQLVEPGDFVLNNQQAWRGSVGVSKYKGIVSPAYLVLSLSSRLDANFANYLFRDGAMVSQYLVCSRGVGTIQRNLYWAELRRVNIYFPPIREQTTIAQFLDRKTAQIDKAIGIKNRQIELLKERRQLLIHKAVTQGLNPDAIMKDSCVEWIGEIPAHWEVKRAKYLFNEIDERSKTGKEELLSVSHMTGVTPRSEKNITMFLAEDYSGSKLCRENDLIFNIMWAWMGALGVSDRSGIVSPSYAIYRQKDARVFNSWFLEHLLRDVNYVAHYNRVSTGLHSSRLRFYSNMFFNMEIGFPPREEQDKIVTYLKEISSKISLAITIREKEIEKLTEYKASLINNAVTGKIKVC